MKTLPEMIAVMQAALDGKPIQQRHKYAPGHGWFEKLEADEFNWDTFDYRVKPEPKPPLHVTYLRADSFSDETERFISPDILDSRSEDSIQFIELTPEVKQKLGMPA